MSSLVFVVSLHIIKIRLLQTCVVKSLAVLISTLIAAVVVVAATLYSFPSDSFQPAQFSYGTLSESNASAISPVIFENVTNLTYNPTDSVYGQIAAWNNNVYMLWQDSIPPGYRNYDIFIKTSKDNGTTFGTPINLSNNSGFSEHPQIAAYDHQVYAVWADDTSGNREVLFTRSDDDGNSFSKIRNLSNNTSDSFNQEISAFGDNVYVVWLDRDEGNNTSILLKVSGDGGRTFGNTMNISSNANEETFPKVSASGNNVYLAWNMNRDNVDEGNQGLFFVRSLDGGKTFDNVAKLDQEENFGEVQVSAYNETVYLVSGGHDSANVDGILFTMSSDRGGNFSEPITIEKIDSLANPQNVEVSAYNGQVSYVSADEESDSGNGEIVFLEMNGSNPTRGLNLSNNANMSECSSIAVTNSNIYVVWEDRTPGNHEILYAKGTRA